MGATQDVAEFISANITDASGVSIKQTTIQNPQPCSVKFAFGLYEGEYYGWLLCTKTVPRSPANLIVLYGFTQPTQQVIANVQFII